jgi:translocation and assembly module TamA
VDLNVAGPGAGQPEFSSVRAAFPLQEGAVFIHADYELARARLEQAASENGYFDFELTRHEVIVDAGKNAATIHLHVKTGERYRFGEVRIEQDILRQNILEKSKPVVEGKLYSVNELLELQKFLTDSGYFSHIEVTPRPEQADDLRVPIDVQLTPHKRNLYSIGVGYGTDTGARTTLGWKNRRINRRGHHMNAEISVAEIQNSQSLRYTIPLHLYRQDEIALTANRTHEYDEDRDELVRSLSIGRIQGRELWRRTIALTYSAETFVLGEEREQTKLLMPSVNWLHVNADNRIYTRRGDRIIIDLRMANSAIVSDVTFFQAQVQGKTIWPLGSAGRLLMRAGAGATNVNQFDEFPSSLRFFAGGDQSVRGYDYKNIGPTDDDGTVIGGKHLFTASVEVEHRFAENWSSAVFYDAGNAFNTVDQATPLLRGAGVGLRWHSPIGPVRLDFAWALDRDDKPWRIHIVVGPDL